MKRERIFSSVLVLGLLLALVAGVSLAQGAGPQGPQAALGTAFTYQGHLTDGGSPANGTYDFEFKLYDAADIGSQVGSTVTAGDVTVSDGLFTVELDFGSGAFNGEALWLEIGVRGGSENGAYTTLSPRQALTPAPYALALPGLWTQQNDASPNLIGGYSGNSVTSGVVGAAIGGGGASGFTNRVTDDYGAVGGGYNNKAGDDAGTTTDAPCATVGGGWGNDASGEYATVGGGWGNDASGYAATVGGGGGNDTFATYYATVGGGRSNDATGDYATVGGGWDNTAAGDGAFVGGGGYDGSDFNGNQALAPASTIGGGYGNAATGDYATVGGGYNNDATDQAATVGGGWYNAATGWAATVGGGQSNAATASYATVGGGLNNTASGYAATVGGGRDNDATASYATVPGGYDSDAGGAYSFAAGLQAKANNQGCFVWGDSSTFSNVACNNDNRTIFRSSGGYYIYTNSGLSSGVYVAANGGSWNSVSSRERKENFQPVDTRQLLTRLSEIPITTWNYKAQDPSIRHIGPMADEFNSLVEGLGGEGQEYINGLDADGVALAAIQGLYELSQEQAARIEDLEAENDALRQSVDNLEARVAALEATAGSASGPLQSSLWPGAGALLLTAGVFWTVRRREGVR